MTFWEIVLAVVVGLGIWEAVKFIGYVLFKAID
jgi:hypothetical protein